MGGSRLREATYQHAEELKAKLNLNIQAFMPKYTTAHYDAVYGGVPELTEENEEAIKAFSTAMKLEPFQRGVAIWPRQCGLRHCVRFRIRIVRSWIL